MILLYFYLFFINHLHPQIPIHALQPLEGGPGHELPEQEPPKNTGTVLYIGRIPHGFYENEMEGVFSFSFTVYLDYKRHECLVFLKSIAGFISAIG